MTAVDPVALAVALTFLFGDVLSRNNRSTTSSHSEQCH